MLEVDMRGVDGHRELVTASVTGSMTHEEWGFAGEDMIS
jgi:hypothetical protein